MSAIHHHKIITHSIFSEEDMIHQPIQCSSCLWQGKATDAEQEHLFLTDATELYCPVCSSYLGFVSHEHKQ